MFAPLQNRLHLRHIQLLLAIDRHGSLNKAASHVGLTQPGASKYLAEIEQALGQELFVRSTKGLRATEAGRCALRHAAAVSAHMASLTDELSDIGGGHGGKLRVGAIMGAVPFVVEKMVRFLESRPNISVEFEEDTSQGLLDLLDKGQLDLVVGRTSVRDLPERYATVAVRDETLAVVANAAHPAMQQKQVSLVDLVEARWIVYTANMPMRVLLEREFAQAGLPFPRNLIETRSVFATLALIQKSRDFVALLSSDAAGFFTGFDLAAILPVQLYSRSEPYELIVPKGPPLTPLAQAFMGFLRG